jgi:hypothetical protein
MRSSQRIFTSVIWLCGILSTLLLTSCPNIIINDPILTGANVFPEGPVNLGDINSSFDDYNSAYPPVLGDVFPLYFSSNRRNGTDFDIIDKILSVRMDRRTSILVIAENKNIRFGTSYAPGRSTQDLNFALEMINTRTADELGPYIIGQGSRYYSSTSYGYDGYIVMFANNLEGNHDIKFTHNLGRSFGAPQSVEFVNSAADDAYPTFTQDSSALYFCSNRAGTFDVYSASLQGSSVLAKLENVTMTGVSKDTVLSSEYDDKCPFISGNILVFTSNRPGGFGGYDLYYSLWQNGRWSQPVNFGERINTRYDEYRPILKDFYGFRNNFMIFSSNRPGGKGGFDLYYVGVPKQAN